MSLLYATHARIHLGNVRDNLRAIRATVGPSRKVLIAVKANGYGHGAVEVSRMAEATGTAEWLGVATVPEGVQLREAGLRLPILKLGPTFPWEMRTAVEAGVTLAGCSNGGGGGGPGGGAPPARPARTRGRAPPRTPPAPRGAPPLSTSRSTPAWDGSA